MTSKVQCLILSGDGLNCEHETTRALSQQGASTQIMTVNDLIKNKDVLKDFHLLAIPGGFSYGDEISSGQILALKLKYNLQEELQNFFSDPKKLVIGICNGFQALVKLGAFSNGEKKLSLTDNTQGRFINKWSTLKANTNLLWFKDMPEKFELPIRHAQGNIRFMDNLKHEFQSQIALTYLEDENGSTDQIAGLVDPSGRILGLMPHPEACIDKVQLPDTFIDQPAGLLIFKNAISYLKKIWMTSFPKSSAG